MSEILFDEHAHVLMQLLQLFRTKEFNAGVQVVVQRRAPKFEGR